MTSIRISLTGFLLLLLSISPVCALQADNGEWLTVSAEPITVRYHPGLERLADQVLERSGVFLAKASAFLGLEARKQYLIVIAGSKEEFVKVQPALSPAPEWAGALTYPDLNLVLIMSPGAMRSGGNEYWSLLQHEMVHLLLGGAELENRTRLPRWFQEGVATYISGEMNLSRLLQLGWAQITGAVPPFEDLEVRFPQQASRAEVAYARSFLFIRYLTRRFGNDSVSVLVRESLARGGFEEGARAVFGMPLEEIMEGFGQYSRVKATWIPALGSAATLWAFITLLFLLAWYRKRVLGLRTIRRWEMEEQWLDGDWGKRDDRNNTLH